MQVTTDRLTGFTNYDSILNPFTGYYLTPTGEYAKKSRFTRDKFSGKKPKRPVRKLTPMSLDGISVVHTPMKPTSLPTDLLGHSVVISGDIARACASSFNPPFGMTIPGVDTTNYVNACLVGAHNKALEPDFDAPVFMAELLETLEMLANPIAGLRKFVSRKKSIKSFIELTTNQWLQYRYGIRPLLSDIDSIISTFEVSKHRYANVPRKSTDHVVVPVSDIITDSRYSPLSGLQIASRHRKTCTTTVTCSRYYNWTENVYGPLLNNNLQAGFGVIWELIPYSFVVDWFAGVGDWISTFRSDPRITHRGYSATIVTNYTYSCDVYAVRYASSDMRIPWVWLNNYSNYSYTIKRKTRTTNHSLPAWPVVNWDFNDIRHVADGLSLTFQQLSGKRKL